MSRNFRFVKKRPAREGVGKRTAQLKAATKAIRQAARARPPPRMIRAEVKFYDTSLGATAISAATDATAGEYDPSATSMISTPVVGDTEQNRDGKRIHIKNCMLKGMISRAAVEAGVAPGLATTVYVALVQDTQSNLAQMNSEDCFKNTAAIGATNATPLRNLLFGSRFRVLKTQVFDMSLPTLVSSALNDFSTNGIQQSFDWFVPLDMTVNFNAGTTASIANVIDNSLHVIAFATTSDCTIAYNARIRFQG